MLERRALPNVITLARVAAAPVVFILLYVPTFSARLIAWFVFLAAAFSDLWDGWLARKHGWISEFGKFVDPIADKLLLVCTFLPFYLLARTGEPETAVPFIGTFPLWALIVVFGREALVTAMRSLVARRGLVIPAGKAGKLKAVFQNIFIGTAILWIALRTAGERRGWSGGFWTFWQQFHGSVYLVMLAIAIALTVWSLLIYLRAWRKPLRESL